MRKSRTARKRRAARRSHSLRIEQLEPRLLLTAGPTSVHEFLIFGGDAVGIQKDAAISGLIGSNTSVHTAKDSSTGGIRAVGEARIGDAVTVDGNVFAGGSIDISAGARVTGSIDGGAQVDLRKETVVEGTVLAIGPLGVAKDGAIFGDAGSRDEITL